MPLGDKTGPLGRGPRTGRGLGSCSGNFQPSFVNPGIGRGGRGFGFGRGFGQGRGQGVGQGRGRGRFWTQRNNDTE